MARTNLADAAVGPSNLRKIIQDRFSTVEEVAYLTAESWVRASMFHQICPREEVLVSIEKITRKREIPADLFLTFEHGKALHNQLQNSILPGAGVLLGEWSCDRCNKRFGAMQPGLPIDQYAIRRPERCDQCEGRHFLFHEYELSNDEFRINAHPDGVLSLPSIPDLGILEAKSISARGAWEIRNVPKLEHVIQAHIYMWLTGLKWTKVVYWDKGTYGTAAIVEHLVECCEDTLERIKKTLRDLWSGIATQIPTPYRICADASAPRAKSCVVCEQCFSLPAEAPTDDDD